MTYRDILEGLVEELPHTHQDVSIIQWQDGSWLVDGQCGFCHFLEYFEIENLYTENKYNILSGLILEILGYIPRTGEKLE